MLAERAGTAAEAAWTRKKSHVSSVCHDRISCCAYGSLGATQNRTFLQFLTIKFHFMREGVTRHFFFAMEPYFFWLLKAYTLMAGLR
jgi:hypothetical protein